MSAATKLPTLLTAQWSTIADPMPTLAAPLQPDDTTAYFSSPLYDGTGTISTGGFHFAVKNSAGYTMTCYVAAGDVAADGLSATIVQGIDTEGLDYSTSNTDLIPDEGFSAGDAISCNIPGVLGSLLQAVIKGNIATGGTGFTIGTEGGDGTEIITLYRTTTAGAKKGFLRWHTSGKVQFSNDGTNWTNNDDVSASDLAKVSANDTTAGYLNGKLVEGDGVDFTENNDGANETLTIAVDSTELISGDYGMEVSSNDLRVKLATDPALEFSTGLRVKVDPSGGISRTSAGIGLSTSFYQQSSGVAYEAISQYDAVADLPIEVQWYTQLTEVDTNLGDSNTRRRYAMKIVPSRSITDLTAINFRGKEAVNGATVGNLTVSIQTDSASAPSGTLAHANATIAISQATLRTWTASYATRTATFPGAVTLTAGTTYWLVFSIDATDAANYVKLGDASSYDENYLTFTRLTYNLDTTSWGSSSTVLPIFFWTTPSVSLGTGLCKTDADYGYRTWNFVGFASAAASANAACSYYYDIVPGLTGTPGSPYYISTTAGAITSSRVNGLYGQKFSYKIGNFFRNSSGTLLFKIEKGEKAIWTQGSANSATDVLYITWFNPEWIEAQSVSTAAGTTGPTFSNGYYDGTTAYYSASYDNTASFGSGYIYYAADGANYQRANITNRTDIGFTLDNENSGGLTAAFTWRASAF